MDVPTRESLRNLLLERVPANGTTIGNARLLDAMRGRAARASVSLGDADFVQVRDALVREGRHSASRSRSSTNAGMN